MSLSCNAEKIAIVGCLFFLSSSVKVCTAAASVNKLQSVFSVNQNQHAQGIEKTKLSARFQVKTIQDKTVILDVAHNAAASLSCNAEKIAIVGCLFFLSSSVKVCTAAAL
jgi:folylpolyglutamate synthase/dihydropteroate synthase